MLKELRTILPIFLIYMVTTTLFIATFSKLYYEETRQNIYADAFKDLRAHGRLAQQMLRSGATSDEIVRAIDEHDVNIFDLTRERFIYSTFEMPRFGSGLLVPPTHIYYSHTLYSYDKTRPLYLIELRALSPQARVDQLLAKTLFLAGATGIFALFVSFFIIRLSYRPLLRQIKLQNDFITDTAHEINTPLSVILMSLEMFDKNPGKYLNNIKSAAFTLSNLFSDLSINFKHQANQIEEVELRSLLHERVNAFFLSASAKQIFICVNATPSTIHTDRFKLSKIVDNLLSNAVKYSDRNTKIELILNTSNANEPVSLEVINHGSLIKPKNLAKIYEKFSRFDAQNGGFGIGLSLVRRYCFELGFSISCVSTPTPDAKSAAKTTFTVQLS